MVYRLLMRTWDDDTKGKPDGFRITWLLQDSEISPQALQIMSERTMVCGRVEYYHMPIIF